MKSWTMEKKVRIPDIYDLFEQMFGSDFLVYHYDKEHGTKVEEKVCSSILEYSHEHWESLSLRLYI